MFLCLQSCQPQVRNPGPARGPTSRSVLTLGMEKTAPGPQRRALGVLGPPRTPCSASMPLALQQLGGSPRGRCRGALLPGPALASFPMPPKSSPRGMARLAAGGLAAPQKGQTRAVILLAPTVTGLCSVQSLGAVFPSFGAIFSPCYGTWCCMAASELFGLLIGEVDIKAK